jgi:hypothetical protein
MRAKKMECGVFFLQRDPLRLIELHVNMGKLAGDARRATSSLSRRT